MPVETKPWYLSKTVLVNIIAGLAMILSHFVPGAATFLNENFGIAGAGWAILNVVLRVLTKKEISL